MLRRLGDEQGGVLIMNQALDPKELAALVHAGHANSSRYFRCEHASEDGRVFGWHHHAGPHACDWGNHGGECPWKANTEKLPGV